MEDRQKVREGGVHGVEPISFGVTFNIPPILEAQIRELARREGRDVQSLIDEALASMAQRGSISGPGVQVAAAHDQSPCNPLRGSVIRFDDPVEPAIRWFDWNTAT